MKKIIFLSIITAFLSNAYAITIATGGQSGNYYKVGQDINKKVFKGKANVITTAGSVENMLKVAEGKADVALVQADALAMLDIFYNQSGKTSDDLVEVIGKLYTEVVHIVVRKDSKYKKISDLDNAIMVSGGKQSGSTVTASYIENIHNIQFKEIKDMSVQRGLDLLMKKKVDVVFYTSKSSSALIKKYKNIRLLGKELKIKDNKNIKEVKISKKSYKFIVKPMKVYGVDTVIITKKGFKDAKKLASYLGVKNFKAKKVKKVKKAKKAKSFMNLPKESLELFTKIYGNRSILRLTYYNFNISKLKKEKIVVKLSKVNEFVNKVKFISDEKHWKTKNYWSTPLEFLGTGYGDSEEYAMMKALFLVKLGVPISKLKLINISTPLTVKNLKHKEHIALAYFHKKGKAPIILEYSSDKQKIYKYKKQFKYTVIKKANNPTWNKLFASNFNSRDADKIMGKIKAVTR